LPPSYPFNSDPLITYIFIAAELAQRDSVGLNTLSEGPIDHCPQDSIRHIMSCAILGSPHQMLKLGDIRKAMRIRFEQFVLVHDWWPVSVFIFVLASGFEVL